mmetsp:Transcript_5294/g.8177  ORF Transcript_5294/g.8177 Transcript_5294/m.8177 type:complete len:441 (-) Transcript_5294:118-1440(-)
MHSSKDSKQTRLAKRQKISLEREDSDTEERKGPAWIDDDDETVSVNVAAVMRLRKLRDGDESVIGGKVYEERLRRQFEQIHEKHNSWAAIFDTASEDDSGGIFQSSGKLVSTKSTDLPPGHIDLVRMQDANASEPCKGVARAVHFHPTSPLLLTGSTDKKLRVFQVDGKENVKVQSVFVSDMPIFGARFTPDGLRVLATGQRKFFYSWDLRSSSITRVEGIQGRDEKSLATFALSKDGKFIAFAGVDGYVVLVCQRTYRWVANLKMNGTVESLAFSPDSSLLYSFGDGAEVYVWDVSSRRCVTRHYDEGCVHGKVIEVGCNSRGSSYYATGSNSGIVNIYDSSRTTKPIKPVKAVTNLTTAIGNLEFHPSGDILAMSSHIEKDALRLVHLPSMTVFSNWPTSRSPLHKVSTIDFSPNGGFMAVGNARGLVLLYRLNHYPV